MLHKIKLIATVLLVLLGFLLAVGYPDGGVKNVKYSHLKNKIKIPNLTKEGNAKNFINKFSKVKTTSHKIIRHQITNKKSDITTNIIKNKKKKVISVKADTKPKINLIKPKIKKEINLVKPPAPPKEEDEDEGC